jgi:acyl-CoA dehydrogenase
MKHRLDAPRDRTKLPHSMSFDESHDQLRVSCRRFVEQEILPHVQEWEEAGEFPRELYAKAAKAGILGISFPEEYGGAGGDLFHVIVMTEALLTGGSTGVVAGLGSLGIALPPISFLGTEEQKQRFLPPVLRGEKIAALAITEPGAGSDVAGVKTRAVRDGDHYVIDGAKTFITSGTRADFVTVLARTGPDPHGGVTFFVVERGMPGFTVSRALKKTGWWASDTAELAFDGVRVPVSNRIGDEGTGFASLMRNFQSERLGLAVMAHATAEICLADAIEYAKRREAFGRPLTGFQVTRHKLAHMATLVAAARALNYDCARRVIAGEYLVKETSMAKNFATDVAMQVTYEAVQILGGMGYMRETRVERLSRDARLLPIGGGTTEIMNEIIAKHLGLP